MKGKRLSWAVATSALAAGLVLATFPSNASDHSDSPRAVADPAADITDFYAFMKPTAPITAAQSVSDHLVLIATLNPKAQEIPDASPFADRVTLTFRLRRVVGTSPLKISPTDTRIQCSFPTATPPVAVCEIPNLGERQFKIGVPDGDADVRFFAGLRADPAFYDRAAIDDSIATGKLSFKAPGTNAYANGNVLGVVLELDVMKVLGMDAGTPPMLALAVESARQ